MLDWNGNGSYDSFDSQMDYHVSNNNSSRSNKSSIRSANNEVNSTLFMVLCIIFCFTVIGGCEQVFTTADSGSIGALIISIPLGFVLCLRIRGYYAKEVEKEKQAEIQKLKSNVSGRIFVKLRKAGLTETQEKAARDAAELIATMLMDKEPNLFDTGWSYNSGYRARANIAINAILKRYLSEVYTVYDLDCKSKDIINYIYEQTRFNEELKDWS